MRAFEKGERFAELFPNAHTIASGLRVPAAVGDFMMLDAIRASGGLAMAGREERIVEWMRRVGAPEGIAHLPGDGGVLRRAWNSWSATGEVEPDEEVVVFNTGAAQKYPEAVPLDLPRLDCTQAVDYRCLCPDVQGACWGKDGVRRRSLPFFPSFLPPSPDPQPPIPDAAC